ncbi:MAG: hypothetical protein F4021_00515 [Acidimicrobiales bacterium]|nr:hypothetical protein [Acidimicrobiales bacterium]
MLVVSGVGAVPTLERGGDADEAGDGAELGWASLASPAGAAVAESQSQSSTGPSCPEGMVLSEGLCKTPKTEQTDMERVCPQAADGYVLVTVVGELGPSHTCQKTVAAYCVGGKVLHQGQCRTRTVTTTTQTAAATWSCSRGTLISTSGEHGTAWSCKIATGTSCPTGERYRGGICEKQVTTHKYKNYIYTCPSGYTLGADGIAWTCSKSVSPYCTGGQTYRTSPSRGCYRSETYYRTANYRYACTSGYTLEYDGIGWTCKKIETYKKRVCSYDPIAGQQCWWGNRTRTVTKAATRSCPSGYAANGSNCRANSASTRWVKTTRSPITTDTRPATQSCPSGYSPNGSTCRQTKTEWKASGSTPVTSYRYEPASRSCRVGYSWDSTIQLCAKTTTTTAYSNPTAPLTTLTGQPPTQRCPVDGGWTPAGGGRCSRTVLGPPTQAPTGDACSEDLGSLGAGAVSRSGTLAAGCESWKKGNQQSLHHARRYTLTVPAASKLDVAASSSAADVFVHVLTGSGSGAVVVASDDDSGTGTDAALSGVQLAVGTAYTVEVTTSAATVTGAFALTVTITPDKPPVKIVGLADAYGIGQATATASDDFTVEPAGAACTATPAGAKVTAGQGATRTVSLGRAAPFSQKVTVACTATDRSQGTATATLRGHLAVASLTVTGAGCAAATDGTADYKCSVAAGDTLSLAGTAQGPSSALSLAWTAADGATVDTQAQAKIQTVAPDATPVVYSRTGSATVSCTEAGTVTLTATAGAHKRTVTVDVTCAASAVPCDDPLGTLPEGDTARAGAIAADSGCVSANRRTGSSNTYYTRRHKFSLSGPAQVTVDLGNDSANATKLDTYAVLLGGHGADGRVLERNDDGGPGTDSRIARKLPAGDYTIEATTWASRRVGRYRLNVNARHDKKVVISGLADSTESGAGAVAVAAGFTVAPATAACTAAPSTAAVTHGSGAPDRTLTADITAPGSVAVTVSCTAAGHGAAAQTVTLTAELAAGITTIGARALDGGECRTAAALPDGADAAYACTMAKGASLRAEAEATATAATLAVAWATTGGVTIASQQQDTATAVVGPDSTTLHRRTATAALQCTTDGTATATGTLGASTKKALLTITCLPPVQIHGLADTTATGTGQVTVTRAFTVTPPTAACTASAVPAEATVTQGGSGQRTVSVTMAAPASATVTVRCTNAGNAAGVATAEFSAGFSEPCLDALGVLGEGAATRTGAIAADTACTSKARRPGSNLVYYARRHTFSLRVPATVTFDLGSADSNSRRLDTYLVLLSGRSADGVGTALGRDDDSGPSTDSRITKTLAAGDYTVEATTYGSRRVGGYDLRVAAKLAVAITGLADIIEEPGSVPQGGRLMLSSSFAVTPATASCTTNHGTVSAGAGGQRTLKATLGAGQVVQATVTCTDAGRPEGTASAVFSVTGACGVQAQQARQADAAMSGMSARASSPPGTCVVPGADPCADQLGTRPLGTVTDHGTITASSRCTSPQRSSLASVVYYARRYHFTLDADAWVTVEMADAADDDHILNPYLLLIEGHSTDGSGTEIARNDNIGSTQRGYSTDARIDTRFLRAGKYTVEATTSGAHVGGAYHLTVEVTATGLKPSYATTVGTPTTITFNYWPASAQIAVRAAANEELQPAITTTRHSGHGTATVTLTPRLVHSHDDITIRIRSDSGNRTRHLGTISLNASCPVGKSPSVNNEVLCVDDAANQAVVSKAKHRVTPGTLNGILEAATAAIAARPDRDTCGLTANKLAAFMLSIGYHEINHGSVATAPSPMSLGRWDTYALRLKSGLHNRYNYVNDAGGYERTGVWDEPRRAYFHPGVGWWQIDDQGYWPKLNHGQRADTGLGRNGRYDSALADHDSGGEAIATELARRYCKYGTNGANGLKSYLDNTWHACDRYRPDMCYDTHQHILIALGSGHDDLQVTVAQYAGEHSTDGGVSTHRCRWHDDWPRVFDCFMYDTERPEGRAEDSDKWGYNTGQSPLAAPFLAFNYGGRRIAVFPGPVMTALKPAGHTTAGSFRTWIKAVPEGANVRDMARAGAGLWSTGDYDRHATPGSETDDSVLQIEVCDDPGWVLAAGDRRSCEWLSANSTRLAERLEIDAS